MTSVLSNQSSFFIGYLPSRIGKYGLSPYKAPSVLLKAGFSRSCNENGEQNPRFPNTAAVYRLLTPDDYGPVGIYTAYLPLDFLKPLILAGINYIRDLRETSRLTIFCPYITSIEGNWAPGFELGMTGMDKTAFDPARDNMKLPVFLDRAIFLNAYDAEGLPYESYQFNWTMVFLLGRLKASQLFESFQLSFPRFSDAAKTYYALIYQRGMIENLARNLLLTYPDYNQSGENIADQERIKTLNQAILRCENDIPADEQRIIQRLATAS